LKVEFEVEVGVFSYQVELELEIEVWEGAQAAQNTLGPSYLVE
jgi:hypothetical protein